MPLPTLPTSETIRDRILADIESKIAQNTPSLFKAFNRVIAAALALVFTLLYKLGQWTYKQIFTATQSDESLELKGAQYEIPRKSSQAAVLTFDFTGTNGTIIAVGKKFRGDLNGLVYQTLSAFEIIAGVASADAKCLTAGTAGNLLNGDTATVLEPEAGLVNQATVSATVTEGEEQEPLEEYRARISEREKRAPQGGALVDYIAWLKEVEGVTRGFVWGKREVPGLTAGHILVYPITDGDVGGRIPSGAKLTEVHDYIDDPTRAPTQVPIITVLAMTEREFIIDVSALSPDTAEVRAAFTTNLTDFLLSREPKQFLDQIDVRNTISRSQVEAVAIQSGALSITLELFIDGTVPPIESHTLDYFELAKLDSIVFPP